MSVDDCAFYIEMPVERNTCVLAAQKPAEGAFANFNGLPAQVHAVQLEQVESAERHGVVLTAVAEQVKYREAVGIAGDGLAIDDA